MEWAVVTARRDDLSPGESAGLSHAGGKEGRAVQLRIIADHEVDESFELVWTCQGVLRMPRKWVEPGKDGPLDRWIAPWAEWESV